MADHDAIVVGSGINSLACAALLARAGWNVAVLERERELGGAIRTAELTEPGFQHDVFSAWHPLWVGGPAHAELGAELGERGLQYLNTEQPTGTLFPDGESAFLTTSTEGNAAELERLAAGDGEAWRRTIESVGSQAELVFGVLGTELWSSADLPAGTRIVVVGALMALVLILRPAGLTRGREISLLGARTGRLLTKFAR